MGNHDKEKRPPCPSCGSLHILKNGSIHNKKRKYLCKDCGRQFVENPTKRYVSKQEIEYVKRGLLERISLRGLSRMLKISIKWLQNYVNKFYCSISFDISSLASCVDSLILECDELWSFVCSKENPVYIWLALDRNTRQIVGFHLGDRTREDAQQFWESIPQKYRDNAEVYTDFWQSYEKVIPADKHYPSGKETGETSHIERFNNTLRQRCSRLVRKSLSFSKKFFNHESAILYFINYYNEELGLALT